MRCIGQLSILFNSSVGREKIMYSLDHSYCQSLIKAQFHQFIIVWILILSKHEINRVSSPYRGGHTQWHQKLATQVKESYISLTRTSRSHYQGFAVHGILYTILPLNPLNAELNPICYLLALLAHHFLHVSRIRDKSLTLRLLTPYIYGAPILDVCRSHTTTQHSR